MSCLDGTSLLENISKKSKSSARFCYFSHNTYLTTRDSPKFLSRFNELILSKCSHSELDRSTALAFLDWYHIMENVIDGADNWKETCGSGHLHYKECSGDPLVTWKRGYSTLFKILMVNF